MAVPSSSSAYAQATPVRVTAQRVAEVGPRVLPGQDRSDNWTTFVRGLATLGESILVALAVPFIVLGLGLPIALLVRLMLGIFRAFR